MVNVPGWVYKRYAYGDISAEEVEELEKMASSLSNRGKAAAREVVADPSNNLPQIMKEVPPEDRDDVLRALRHMNKNASSSVKSRLMSMTKEADLGMAAAMLGAGALAPVVGHLAERSIGVLGQKSEAQRMQDLKRILQVHPDIGRFNDPRVQMAYATLVRLNPEYAEDPLIAGPLLKQIVEARMDPTNPNSASYIDPAMAKHLSEARKAHGEGQRSLGGFGSDMRNSMMSGTQAAGGQLFK